MDRQLEYQSLYISQRRLFLKERSLILHKFTTLQEARRSIKIIVTFDQFSSLSKEEKRWIKNYWRCIGYIYTIQSSDDNYIFSFWIQLNDIEIITLLIKKNDSIRYINLKQIKSIDLVELLKDYITVDRLLTASVNRSTAKYCWQKLSNQQDNQTKIYVTSIAAFEAIKEHLSFELVINHAIYSNFELFKYLCENYIIHRDGIFLFCKYQIFNSQYCKSLRYLHCQGFPFNNCFFEEKNLVAWFFLKYLDGFNRSYEKILIHLLKMNVNPNTYDYPISSANISVHYLTNSRQAVIDKLTNLFNLLIKAGLKIDNLCENTRKFIQIEDPYRNLSPSILPLISAYHH